MWPEAVISWAAIALPDSGVHVTYLHGHANIGLRRCPQPA